MLETSAFMLQKEENTLGLIYGYILKAKEVIIASKISV